MKAIINALAVASLSFGGTAMANEPVVLSAEQSDPVTMGWMQGFPPPADKMIRFTDPDFFTFPKLRWTVCNFREMMPTVAVAKGPSGARPLQRELNTVLDRIELTPIGSTTRMTWGQAFDANYTDGVIVLHHGQIVYERYAGCLDENTLHGAMSVTKSLTGLLAEVLISEGKLDETARVGTIIPELEASAFGDATVRQVMDMTTGLHYSEDASDPKAEFWAYAAAGSPLPKPPGYEGPRSYFEYLQTVQKEGTHGEAFAYKTINADTLGWLISRVTGQSLAELLSERIWSRMGAEREAFFTVDSTGTAFAGGGFNATLRDLARVGQLMLDNGRIGTEQIIPQSAVERVRGSGDAAKFPEAHYPTLPGWSYGSMWWHSNNAHGAYAARGVYGQTIWVDPAADMVIVRFGSNPIGPNAANDPTSLPAYQAIADHLMTEPEIPFP